MLRAVVVGCGPRGIEHARALGGIHDLKLVAVVDRSAEAVRHAAATLDVPGYSAAEELISEARPDIVVIATPTAGRAELIERVAALPGVRAIVAEKPMALTMREAERMVAVCEDRGILLTVSHQWRFSRELEAMKAALDAGEVGAVEFLRGSCYGNLLRQGIHLLDAMRWLSGGREILWVMSQSSDDPSFLGRHARGDEGYWDDLAHPAPMWMTHHLAFKGGLRATLETGLLYQRSRTFTNDWLQKRLTVIGSEGMAECQTAEHCKLLSTRQAGWTVVKSSLDEYTAATQRFYAELRDALTTGNPHRNDAKDAIKTFEAALACLQSAANGTLIALPLTRERNPLSDLEALRRTAPSHASAPQARTWVPPAIRVGSHQAQPDVSVIVALPDHRGLAIECVESLVRGQTYPRDQYEVIVVSDGSDPVLERQVKAILGPQDRMLSRATTNESLLYDLGAREARGTLLFITEPHCIAEPECLEELVTFFATHDYDGACCRSVGDSPNVMARMEERFFESGFQAFSRKGDWRKVMWRGFAIHREIFLEEGGFEYDFDRFAEHALAARLHSRGRRLGYAAGATVHHRYTTNLAQLFPFVRNFSRGECAYRMSHPRDYCERYFGHAEEWAEREAFRPELARALCQASWLSLRQGLKGGNRALAQSQAQALGRWLPVALLGPRWPLVQARWRLWLAVARSWLWRWREERLYRAYQDAYARMVRVSRLEFISEHLAASVPDPPTAASYRPAEVGEEWLVGFHAVERWGGETFRWSGPVGLIRLGLPRGTYVVHLETRGLRQAPVPLHLRVFFNRHQLPPVALRWQGGTLTFRLEPAMFAPGPEQHLVLTCNPLRPWTMGVPDRRELGLPIFSIDFAPITEARIAGEKTTTVTAGHSHSASGAARITIR